MIESIWYVAAAGMCFVALANWRIGLYLAVIADVARDPIRKVADDQTVLVTLTGAAVWGAVLVGGLASNQRDIRLLLQRYPRLRHMMYALLGAVFPAAMLSTFLFPGGYKLALVGGASYLGPAAGIALGWVFATSEREVYRFLRFYACINAVFLVGTPFEYFGADWPVLGGIDVEWIRYQQGYIVDLISGFYRSPDIMGLHAAHTVVFSSLLAIRARGGGKLGWSGVAAWAAYCLVLAGRRKMIGIPLVFIAAMFVLGSLRKLGFARHFFAIGALSAAIGGGMIIFLTESDYSEHTSYASTLFTEGPARFNELIVKSSIGTLQQAGVLGAGLGTATQGRYYVGVQTSRSARGWQEDGASRLLMEFGIPGTVLLFVAAVSLLGAIIRSVRIVPRSSSAQALQVGLAATVIADGASYLVSHQQFSGDPASGLLVTILVGTILGGPRMHAAAQAKIANRPPMRPQNRRPVPQPVVRR